MVSNASDSMYFPFQDFTTHDTRSRVLDTDTFKYVDNTTAFWFNVLVFILANACISICGIMTNIINILVFIRQGVFTDNGSISLLGLAVSDLCSVTSMLWLTITYTFVLADPPGLPFFPPDLNYLAGGWPHIMCAQITRTVTAYVAFERCICVVFPFKVKSLFTPRRSIIVIAGIFVCFGLSYSPVFITQQLKFRHDPRTNSTRLILVSSPAWRLAVDVMYYINSITFNIGSVISVLVCTMITVVRVNLSKTWRESMTKTNTTTLEDVASGIERKKGNKTLPSQVMSKTKMQKEKKLVRMIISISIIFLVCYTPDLAYLIMFSVDPEIRILKRFENLALVMYSFTFFMETMNSSINIIVYYTMSSRYKQEFKRLFRIKET